MARFYTSTENSRNNTVTAMGNKRGQYAHIRGWNAGVRVSARPSHDAYTDQDEFDIYMTGGSNGLSSSTLIGTIIDTPEGPVFKVAE